MSTWVRYDAPPGWPGPPLHRHADVDEAVYLLSGRLTLRLGDTTHDVAEGWVRVDATR